MAPVLRRTRLAGPAFRAYERVLAGTERGSEEPDEGLPVPPAHLRVVVGGVPPREGFLASGRSAADALEDLFGKSGLALREAESVLDFGCGCGRITRHWRRLAGVDVHGCDYNPRLVEWSAANLPHVTTVKNGLRPPAPYPDERFDAIYAISVFTHLPEELQHAWIADLARMLRPEGRLLFTTHGAPMAGVLLAEERVRFDAGEFVVRFEQQAGSNLCNAFHPDTWVREQLVRELTVDLHQPGGAPGLGDQDIWVVRRNFRSTG